MTGNQTWQSDIVIIGGGGAGLMAAAAALENGVKSLIILEKRSQLGGNAVNPAGLLAAETPLQKKLGMDSRKDEVFRKAMEYSHWRINGPLVRALIDKSADTLQWMEDKGVKFTSIVTHYPNQFPNTYHTTSGTGAGRQIVTILSQELQKSKAVRILCNTPAVHITIDKEGRVSGVRAKNSDGATVNIKAKGVIISTGGFSGNEKLIQQYDPAYKKAEIPPRGIPLEGDGIKMAAEIGAALDGMVSYEWEHFSGTVFLTTVARKPVNLWVNKKGQRFTDESIQIMVEAANAIYRQPGKIMYCLFDSSIKDTMLSDVLTPFEAFFIGDQEKESAAWPFAEKVEKDIAAMIADGKASSAMSWTEIAGYIGAKPEILRATIDEYNSFCAKGHDDIFAKNYAWLKPLLTPPFYALKCNIGLTATHGGIKINQYTEVLNNEDEPIPGLYAAGNETGATDGESYNMALSGHSFSFAVNTGRIAGQQAAAYILKK